MDPKNFSSYWRFVSEYCFVEKGSYGTSIEGTRNKEQLKELLRSYYTTRRYADVKEQMPPLRRQLVELEMEPEQTKLYNEMQKTMMLVGEESLVLASGALARDTRLRQIALCPQSLSLDFPVGAGVEYLMEEIPAEDQHTVVFSVYKQVLYVVKKQLESQGVKCFILQGGMEPNEIVEEVRRFKESGGTMLCTIAFAQSFALDTVSRAYVLGLDPDPINNIQAEGRLRRGDSDLGPEGVLVRYIIIKGTREEDFKEIVNTKISNIEKFMPNYSG
jgi:superfamily II DNA/RNA helicase